MKMRRVTRLAILGLSSLLSGFPTALAQQDYPALIRETLDYLANYPDDLSERLRLGYYEMQAGDYRQAAQSYGRVVHQDSLSSDGWKGLLWASNSLKEWDQTLRLGRRAQTLIGEQRDLIPMMAYAALEKGDYPQARRLYLRSLKTHRPYPDNTAGLGWTYLRLGNPSLARRYLAQSEDLARDDIKDNPFRTASWTAAPEIYLLSQKTNEVSWYFGATISHSLYSWSVGANAYLRSGKRIRTDYLTGWAGNTAVFDYLVQGHYLYGSYGRLYPAFSVIAGLSKPVYGPRWILIPGLTQAFSNYPSVQTYQTEGYISSRQGRFYEALSLYVLHHSYSSPDSTRNKVCLQGTLGYTLFKNMDIYLLGGFGPKAFLVSRYAFLVDNFTAPDREAGLLVDYRLQGLDLEGMFKMAREKNRWSSVSYLSLSKGFRFLE